MKKSEKILNCTHSPLSFRFDLLVSSWSAWYLRFQYASPIGPGVSLGGSPSSSEDADGASGDEARHEVFRVGGIEAKVKPQGMSARLIYLLCNVLVMTHFHF